VADARGQEDLGHKVQLVLGRALQG
jgi:hypothetical protein